MKYKKYKYKYINKSFFKFYKKLGGALDIMKYYTVNKIEGNYATLQNIYTHKISEIKTSKLPPFLSDGDILKKSGLTYEFDFQKTTEIKKSLNRELNYIS